MNYHRDKDYLESESLFRNIFKKRFRLIIKLLGGGRVLDIGCSTGVFLDLFRESGWETWGVEPSSSALVARKKSHKVVRNVFEKTELPKDYFDLVILNHTLEHMENPAQVLQKVKIILKKGGVLYLDVPNAGGLGAKLLGKHWPYLLPKEHKYQFSKQSLSTLLSDADYKIIHFESRSGLFEFANPFLELWQAFVGLKKRFFTDILTIPYCLVASALQMGDSMSIIARK